MQKCIILHSNDIHGHIEGLARITTIIERVKAENPGVPVLYLDGGDVEETTQRLSNLTKGAAMHRLLDVAGCNAAAIGNGGLARYSPAALPSYAGAGHYPHLLANLRQPDGELLEGAQATALLDVGTFKLGMIGVSASLLGGYPLYKHYYNLESLPVQPLVHELASELRQQGADVVLLLSHLGLVEDVEISFQLQNDISLIVGAHTHNLIPAGVWSGKILIAQAGEFARYLGRLDLLWTGEQLQVERVSVIPITRDIPLSPRFQQALAELELEVDQSLQAVVGYLAEPLDLAFDRECRAAQVMAAALQAHMEAEVGLVTAGLAFQAPLPAGFLKRLTLWEACPSPAAPGKTQMSGAQLELLAQRGQDLVLAAQTPHALRGRARGLMHLSGASLRDGHLYVGEKPVEAERLYTVAATDWELGAVGGYVDPLWDLRITYDVRAILRDVIEGYLR